MSAEGRVEHQKLNQTTALLLFDSVFGVQLDYSVCRFLFREKKNGKMCNSNLAKKIPNEKKLKKLTCEQMHFYKLKEACSTSSLQSEAKYNQLEAKSVELPL